MRGQERLVLLYDGECNLCLNTVALLRKIRTTADLIMVPLQEAPPELLPMGVAREELLAQLHVTDGSGKLYRGPEAVVRIMRTVPSLRWIGFLYRLPGMKKPAELLYRLIAKHRYRLFGRTDPCESGACRLPERPSSGNGHSTQGKDEKHES